MQQEQRVPPPQKGKMTAAGEMLGEPKACVTLRISSRTGTLLHSVKIASTVVIMLLTLLAMASQVFAVSLFSTLPSGNDMQMLIPVGFSLALFLLDIFVVVSKTRTYSTIGFVLYTQFLMQLTDSREGMPGLSVIHRNAKVKQTWVICSDFKTDPRSRGHVDRDFCSLMLYWPISSKEMLAMEIPAAKGRCKVQRNNWSFGLLLE